MGKACVTDACYTYGETILYFLLQVCGIASLSPRHNRDSVTMSIIILPTTGKESSHSVEIPVPQDNDELVPPSTSS